MNQELAFFLFFGVFFTGLVMTVLAQVSLCRTIAKESVFAALFALVVPFAVLFFVKAHWNESKSAVKVWGLGISVILASIVFGLVLEELTRQAA